MIIIIYFFIWMYISHGISCSRLCTWKLFSSHICTVESFIFQATSVLWNSLLSRYTDPWCTFFPAKFILSNSLLSTYVYLIELFIFHQITVWFYFFPSIFVAWNFYFSSYFCLMEFYAFPSLRPYGITCYYDFFFMLTYLLSLLGEVGLSLWFVILPC